MEPSQPDKGGQDWIRGTYSEHVALWFEAANESLTVHAYTKTYLFAYPKIGRSDSDEESRTPWGPLNPNHILILLFYVYFSFSSKEIGLVNKLANLLKYTC